MSTLADHPSTPRRWPAPKALLRLVKPWTWFPPMWAYLCGVVSVGTLSADWTLVALGVVLAGPVTCGMSQAANDWCDRHVDAINEPDRPIPSGAVPGRWGLWIALAMTLLSLAIGWQLGAWGFGATALACAAAWAYSAEPLRAKRSPLWGPLLCGLAYETLPWITGAAVLSAGAPSLLIMVIATLYGIGAYGIMVLNDFKSVTGDRALGLRSLPVVLGPARAARVACWAMTLPQIAVIILLDLNGKLLHGTAVAALLAIQLIAMRTLLRDPLGRAQWYQGMGILFFIAGMMVTATALRSIGG
ncbi:chlorophyll synthase [Loktanella sp. DSM 29012]|uniref:chlorophyll synthase ChlG n=1 Tax=Loktanella sp. DSM 29012 TaxID=1881056 RepID=UPI0008D0A8C2|nr:chlorophyll synthase ChlG [Loktanella sp. DSM 29012]SEP57089.1 chlorophyll synthase [Loktanella sp. DSM 29012]